jgi:hypothetical protein
MTLTSPQLFLFVGVGSPNINVWAVLAVMALGLGLILFGWLRRR